MGDLNLNIINNPSASWLAELTQTAANQLKNFLSGPSLIDIPGENPAYLFISVLLHGNETTGWEAICHILRSYEAALAEQKFPRSICLFIGNIDAAAKNKRVLAQQLDYNRAWIAGDKDEQQLMQEVLSYMQTKELFVSLDIHNNTGLNPHYACINRLDSQFLHLARLFSEIIVYFIKPDSVQSMAFANLCPAITIECGQPGQSSGEHHAIQLIDTLLNLSQLPAHVLSPEEVELYHTMAVVKVPTQFSFSFSNQGADIDFQTGIEKLNFRPLHDNEIWATLNHPDAYLEVIDEQGNQISERYFSIEDGKLISHIHLMPSMLTTNTEIVRQDCLCYIMEKVNLNEFKG